MASSFCIVFAGCVGSSKTPIAHFLSASFDLPIHNNDAIRTEVLEDLGAFDQEHYLSRRDVRIALMLKKGRSFICDASIDRQWKDLKPRLSGAGYEFFLISLDWSKERLEYLHRLKHYDDSLKALDENFADHENFLRAFGDDVGIHLTDQDFPDRLARCRDAVAGWLAQRGSLIQ